jgi:hypothetical protein
MILALETSEIASDSGDGERARPREEMKEWLFLDGVHIQRDRTAVDEGVKLAILVLSDSTNASFRERDEAAMVAEVTLHLLIL